MGVRIYSQCVRHGGYRGASLVDGPENCFFNDHPGQSIRVLNIPRGRIGRNLCGYQYCCGCALRKPYRVDRTRYRFPTGCMCPLVIPFFCALIRFVLAGFDTFLDRRAGWANWSISYATK